MISFHDVYEVLVAVVPLYVAMLLAYASVRWWSILDPAQCSGITRYVAVFAVPILCFSIIAFNDPYAMNLRFLFADSLQKLLVLLLLSLYLLFFKNSSLDWSITLYSLSTLPNTLVMGIPLLKAMYGDFTASLMVQVVMMQSVVWYSVMIVLFEYRGARKFIENKFGGGEVCGSIASFRVEPDVVSLSGVEVLEAEVEDGENGKVCVVIKRCGSAVSRPGSVEIYSRESSGALRMERGLSYLGQHEFGGAFEGRVERLKEEVGSRKGGGGNKDLHMFDWSSSKVWDSDVSRGWKAGAKMESRTRDGSRSPGRKHQVMESPFLTEAKIVDTEAVGRKPEGNPPMPSAMVVTKLILTMVWRKIVRNPNTYSSVIGLAWSLISFRWNIEMPKIVKDSISILSNTGLGMAMFSLGIFMALQPKIIACGKSVMVFAMAVKFLLGPATMAATSAVVGVRGVLLRVAIVQAALPAGIAPFIFAKEYNCHADILSTSVIFGMVVALPVTILYYILLQL